MANDLYIVIRDVDYEGFSILFIMDDLEEAKAKADHCRKTSKQRFDEHYRVLEYIESNTDKFGFWADLSECVYESGEDE